MTPEPLPSDAAAANPPARGDFPAPMTLSAEARQALAGFTRADRDITLPTPDDVAGWRQVHAKLEAGKAAANEVVVRRHQPEITARTLGGVPVLDIKPQRWRDSRQIMVYAHGGAYTFYSARSRLISAVPMAAATGRRIISVDYTVAPQAQWREVTE